MTDLQQRERLLLDELRSLEAVVVAYSGGVDSAVLAAAAFRALGDRAVAVTGVSPSLSAFERQAAQLLAAEIGIRHLEMPTEEFENPEYVRNDEQRCFHCKTELYSHLVPLARELNARIVNGTNLDDLHDFRPGLAAAKEQQVLSPLASCRFSKADVRELAMHWHLPVSEKPATPCLSSRVAYGEEVTPQRLQMIELAEDFLRSKGLAELRVRYHRGDLARIEVPDSWIASLADPGLRSEIRNAFHKIGFRFVTLDLDGFRSGSLNSLVPLVVVK